MFERRDNSVPNGTTPGHPVKPRTAGAGPPAATPDTQPPVPATEIIPPPAPTLNAVPLTEAQAREISTNKPSPWLITAWPGMGNVAMICAVYLIQKLDARPFAEVSPVGHFDIEQVEVRKGVAVAPHMPRSVFYRWENPKGRDLVIFVGESQPSTNSFAFAQQLVDHAVKMGVNRVVTFASLASQLHPSADPRVHGVGTDKAMLEELRRLEVRPLEDGQIGGLNGVLIGAAAERGVPGMCLLGEIPFFAAGVPNPKAARAVLDVLCPLAGIELNFDELTERARTMEKAIMDLLKQMKRQAGQEDEDTGYGSPEEDEEDESAPSDNGSAKSTNSPPAEPDPAVRMRIERLFDEATQDRAKAVRLKQDLDRLGVFKLYEDRFLDLFKKAG